MENLKNTDWHSIHGSLDAHGYAVVPRILSENDCREIIDLYANEKLFRSTVNMQRYRFG